MSYAKDLVARMLMDARKANIQAIVGYADQWRPGNYRSDVQDRICYYSGDMRDDVTEALKKHFSNSWARVDSCQANVRLVRFVVDQRASVFSSVGQIYLVDRADNRLAEDDPVAKTFDRVLQDMQIWPTLQDIDGYTTLCQRCLVKPWWDGRQMRISSWTPDQAHVLVDPDAYWDFDRAYGVALEIPSEEGLSGTPRLEVWAILPDDDDRQSTLGITTLHYYTGDDQDSAPVDGESIIYRDPTTGAPFYPLYWMHDDLIPQIYYLDNVDMLEINRAINVMMADMRYGMRYQTHAALIVTRNDMSVPEPATLPIGPDVAVVLPPGAQASFMSPQTNLDLAQKFVELIARLDVQVDAVNPSAVFAESSLPQSGIALKIKSRDLERYLARKRLLYEPQVCELLRRSMIVHDAHASERLDLDARGMQIKIQFGDTSMTDTTELAALYDRLIDIGASSPIEARQAIFGESSQQAESAVDAAKEVNADVARSRVAPSPMGGSRLL
jgi:hypothetical protein